MKTCKKKLTLPEIITVFKQVNNFLKVLKCKINISRQPISLLFTPAQVLKNEQKDEIAIPIVESHDLDVLEMEEQEGNEKEVALVVGGSQSRRFGK